MLNHMIVWNGWIFPAKPENTRLYGPTRSEMATFERMVLKAESKPRAPTPQPRRMN